MREGNGYVLFVSKVAVFGVCELLIDLFFFQGFQIHKNQYIMSTSGDCETGDNHKKSKYV